MMLPIFFHTLPLLLVCHCRCLDGEQCCQIGNIYIHQSHCFGGKVLYTYNFILFFQAITQPISNKTCI